jgi:glucosyl-3-phosphoglycerate synthase
VTFDPSGWFPARTHRISDFSVADLIERKRHAGTTVSVVLPARNEAATVGGVVRAVCELHGTLVDEVVVIDAASTDGTAEIAVQAGAVVHQENDVLAEFGPALGKGDALWRGLAVASGEVVVFIDSDIRNPDPRFVWGLLGPLLTDPAVGFVKAFYERPLEGEEGLQASGGGRVTELLARPALNLLWPELSGVVQPLSGEYAGWRELLTSVPFLTGYGVEIGLLIDIATRRGVDAIAQVDLLERVHRNQSLESLSRMAYGILQAVVHRLDQEGRASVDLTTIPPYVQFSRTAAGVQPDPQSVEVVERPPLATLSG